ncbi:glycoside-pentoside-hexuronide (GPH):cation symporter [Bifidobacterium stellenboschense]|uniref:Galactoside transport protein n=1 Tax=Bifidobacterium stellenboschense TaxID=762211 RepID=A0A087E0V4_9BIFI|nr:glycoside-pentoside-hexuronide (GPH):cation symporter [Bifidobacterium stellenboschense]KFJ01405.1 galactoside transport protein [Bifidobacterium stellenboschense]
MSATPTEPTHTPSTQQSDPQRPAAPHPNQSATTTAPTIHKGRLAAYAFGNFGQALFYNALSTYFVVYATTSLFAGIDKALAAKLIGVITSLVMIIRIAEIFIDPLLGNLVDNTTTRIGRFRPWQFIGGTVSAILLLIIFTGMFGLVNVNTTAFIITFVIVFIVLDVFYSLRDISYWGMVPAISSDSHERSVYTAAGTLFGSLGYNGLTIAVIPITTMFAMDHTTQTQGGWTAFGVIVALIGILTCWTVGFGVKENDSALRRKAEANGNPLQAFKALGRNDQLLWTALAYLFYSFANVATGGVMVYLFKYVVNRSDLFSITGIIPFVAGILLAPLFPVVTRRVPRKAVFLTGVAMMGCAYVLFIIAPTNITVVITALVLFYAPQTLIQMTGILCLEDSVEYGQLKTGRRNEAVTLSVRPMLDKIAGALSNGFVGFVAVAAGMIGTATAGDMTPANIATFKGFAFYMPLAFIAISFLTFLFGVKLSEKAHARIVRQLEAGMGGDSEPEYGKEIAKAALLG